MPLPAPGQRLNEDGVGVAPHDQPARRTYPWMECDDFLVFLVFRAVIEAYHYFKIVAGRPVCDENQVGNLEGETLWQNERLGGNAALGQVAHNPAQISSRTVIIVSAVRYGPVPTSPVRKPVRFGAAEGIG